jgi:hypothetical protein
VETSSSSLHSGHAIYCVVADTPPAEPAVTAVNQLSAFKQGKNLSHSWCAEGKLFSEIVSAR